MTKLTEEHFHEHPESFSITKALSRVERAIRPFNKAALFDLYDHGYQSPFEQTIACMISIRTRDETTIPMARRLFDRASTPTQMMEIDEDAIYKLIAASSYARTKAKNILKIARRCLDEYGGELPCDEELLLSLPGIGPKCANLVLGIVGRRERIGVDIHVHRVSNRWGYIQGATPEKTLAALEAKLPQAHWIDFNRLLMPFGKHICTGNSPHCSTCPLYSMCPKIDVTAHR